MIIFLLRLISIIIFDKCIGTIYTNPYNSMVLITIILRTAIKFMLSFQTVFLLGNSSMSKTIGYETNTALFNNRLLHLKFLKKCYM